MRPRSWPACLALLALLPGTAAAAPASSAGAPDFLREVRPILSTHCFKCHGPDEGTRKGGLRLDERDMALRPGKSGETAIVPGQPDRSELVARIFSTDADELMPPPAVKHPLTPAQKDILKRWVAAGAEYRPHWAFLPPRAIVPPPGAAHPVDAFVRARLKQEGLKPAPEADRLTLARRLHLDLIGLPPTPEAADAFAADRRADAYERLVDQLLASPHYGERWARRWLDLARYADSNGYEKDRTRSIWPYRDWVIRALNADLPFDRFTIEQLAGDMLPGAGRDQRVATGFHRNTMLNEEGGIDPLEFRHHAVVDRVNTTGTAWLGLTVGCAQCHTHKYDPILHKDYYALMAFLNNADEPDLDLPADDAAAQERQRAQEAARLLAELPSKWPVDTGPLLWARVPLTLPAPAAADPGKAQADGSLLFAAPGPDRADVTVRVDAALTNVTHLRLEALADDALPQRGPGRTPHGNFVVGEVVLRAVAPDGAATPVRIRSARATAEQAGFPVANLFDGDPGTGWAVHQDGKKLNQDQFATLELERPLTLAAGHRLEVRVQQPHGKQHTIGRLALGAGTPRVEAAPVAVRRAEALEQAFQRWLERERARSAAWVPLRPASAKANLPLLTVQPDASVLASGDISKSDTYDLVFTQLPGPVTALRLEALPDDSLPAHGPGLAYYEGPKGDFFLGELQVRADGRPVAWTKATHSHAKNNFGGGASAQAAVDGDPQTGWSCADRPGEAHQAVFVPSAPITAGRLDVRMLFGRHYACSLGRFRISVTTGAGPVEARDELPGAVEALLRVPDAQLTAAQRGQLREQFLLTAPELAKEARRIRDLRKPARHTTTLVLRERPASAPRPTFIHNRGEFLQPTTPVSADVPHFLPSLPAGASRDRLALAQWLVSPGNPLTARVVVNRHWAALFGQGLVATLNDFGTQGELPSHPELLDWLAVEFIRQGWSQKQLHRLLVTSATYRQASRVTPALLARDPQNRLLARGPRVRLEGEFIRDAALAAAGVLSPKMFGPPVRPPQAAGVTEVAYGGSRWEASQGEDRWRRSLYTFQKRTAPFALFTTFDAPSGEACVARRDVSNTPLQSLMLLNDVVFLEAAQKLGALAAARGGDDAARAVFLFRRVLVRPPSAAEQARLLDFLGAQRARLASGELKAADLADAGKGDAEAAAWTLVARAVLNLDEAITKN